MNYVCANKKENKIAAGIRINIRFEFRQIELKTNVIFYESSQKHLRNGINGQLWRGLKSVPLFDLSEICSLLQRNLEQNINHLHFISVV